MRGCGRVEGRAQSREIGRGRGWLPHLAGSGSTRPAEDSGPAHHERAGVVVRKRPVRNRALREIGPKTPGWWGEKTGGSETPPLQKTAGDAGMGDGTVRAGWLETLTDVSSRGDNWKTVARRLNLGRRTRQRADSFSGHVQQFSRGRAHGTHEGRSP